MARLEVDVGPFPENAKSLVLDYREEGQVTYVRMGETTDARSHWTIAGTVPVFVRARYRDRQGRIQPGIEERWAPTQPVQNRPDPATLTMPAPVVEQDGPKLSVRQDVPDGTDPDEFAIEAVQTTSGATSPKDGLHLGYHKPGEEIPAHAWPGDQKVYTRPVRLEDEDLGAWTGTTVSTPSPAVLPTEGFSTDFAGGTIKKLGGATIGQEPLEVNGGDLRHKALYAGDADGYAGDATYFAGDAGLYWGPATFTAPQVTLQAPESLLFQWQPVLTSLVRQTMYAGDSRFYAGGPLRIDIDGSVHDNRLRRYSLQNGADEVPLDIDAQVATSPSTPVTFTDADYKPMTPGKVFHNVKVYAARFIIRTWFGARVTFDKINVWHWVWCRQRPWHTHTPAPELIYENTLGSAAITQDATGLGGDNWDELTVEVVWTNAVSGNAVLWIRPNNDATAGNYVNDAGSDTKFVMGPAIAQNEIQRAVLRIVKAASGTVREAYIENAHSWTATTVQSPAGAATYIWKNTADPINSFRILTDDAGSARLGIGTEIRIYGKRHHEA